MRECGRESERVREIAGERERESEREREGGREREREREKSYSGLHNFPQLKKTELLKIRENRSSLTITARPNSISPPVASPKSGGI